MVRLFCYFACIVALLGSVYVSAVEFSLIGLSGDWESGEDDAIDVHFDKSGAGWRYQGVLGDTGKNYNLGAAYHRDENVIYFLGSDVFAGGGGGQTNPSAGQRQLYTASMDFTQIQAVSTTYLASATGNDLPQALTFADDQLYIVYRDGSIDRVDHTSGASTAFATLPATPKGVGIGYDDDAGRLIVTSGKFEGAKTIYAVDLDSAAVTELYSNISFDCLWQGLAYLGDAKMLAVGTGLEDCTELTEIDLNTGQFSLQPLYEFEHNNMTYNRYTTDENVVPSNFSIDLVALMRISPWRPDPPTMQSASAGDQEAEVVFDPPVRDGDSNITGYTLTEVNSGDTFGCLASPCTVTGLTNGESYRFTVLATNEVGDSGPSLSIEVSLPVPDSDGDGVIDTEDAYPADPSRWILAVTTLTPVILGFYAFLIALLGVRKMRSLSEN